MKEDAEALGRDTEHGKEEATPLAVSAAVLLPAEDEGLPHLVAGEAVGAAETATVARPPDSGGPTFRTSVVSCKNPSIKYSTPFNDLTAAKNSIVLTLPLIIPIFCFYYSARVY